MSNAIWFRYNLFIGSQKRGVFDSIYKGTDNFCEFVGEIDVESDTLKIGVEFLHDVLDVEGMGRKGNQGIRDFSAATNVGAVGPHGLMLCTC